MAEINDLNIVDDDNTGRMPENQAPSTVNNGVRALEGILARYTKDINGSIASTGSANAYVVAANQTLSAYYDGLVIAFDANFANTDSATLNVDAVSADTIKKNYDQDLEEGDILVGQKVICIHDGTNWQMVSQLGFRSVEQESATATTSGTEHIYSFSSQIKKITIAFRNVSHDGTDPMIMLMGTATNWQVTGYSSILSELTSAVSTTSAGDAFQLTSTIGATDRLNGIATLVNIDGNEWAFSATVCTTTGTSRTYNSAGSINVNVAGGAASRVNLTTSTGTPSFDVGKFNILLE